MSLRYSAIFTSLLLGAVLSYGQAPLSIHKSAEMNACLVCSYQESCRDKSLDFLFISPQNAIGMSYETDGDSLEFLFTFPEGEEPVILMDTPHRSGSCGARGELNFIRAGVPDGDRKYGVILNDADGRKSQFCFDFYASDDYDWQTDDDDTAYKLIFNARNDKVRFTVRISDDPTETYDYASLAATLNFSKAKGKGEIPWDILEEYVRTHPSSVSWVWNEPCRRCGSKTVCIHYTSPEESWKNLAGREGLVSLCPKCMRQLGFFVTRMN